MSSSSASAPASVPAPASFTPFYNNPGSPNARFNPTMAIVIIVLIGGCFVFGFVSVFVRKCIAGEPETINTTVRSPNANPKSRGLDKAAVEALPIVHSSDLHEKDDRECPVCLTEFESEDNLRLLPVCKHVFHQECIDAWFDEHSTCPLCRASLTGVASNTSGEPAGVLRDSAVASVPEVSESGDRDIELHRVIDAASCEDSSYSTQDAHTVPSIVAPTPTVATMSRDDSFNSARGALSRNSQSFKRAARGATALERAHSLGAQFSKPPVTPTANSRKPPLTPAASTTTGIRRSSSLGTDIVALRKLLLGGDQQQGNASSIASRRLTGVAMADAPPSRSSWFRRARSMNLSSRGRSLPRMQSNDNWVGMDLEFGKISPPEPSTSQTESFTAPERTRSGRWSLAGLRGAMSRSTSDVNTRTNNPHLPV